MINKPLAQANQEVLSRKSLGLRLREARQARNISLAEAAAATRISQRIMTALETDDFAALPAEVFTRGFIKLYAEYLGLDTSEVLKLFTVQENLDPERPADRPYRNDILHGKAMANPLHFLKGNPRLRIIAMLLTALLSFYVLGAIFKTIQKHPDQDAPENEVAKSLVNGEPQMIPIPSSEEIPPAATSAPQALSEAPPLTAGQTEPQNSSIIESAPPQTPPIGNGQNTSVQTQSSPIYPMAVAIGRDNSQAPSEGTAPQAAAPRVTAPVNAVSQSNRDYRYSPPNTTITR